MVKSRNPENRIDISPLNNLLATVGKDLDINDESIPTSRSAYQINQNAEWLTKSITVTVKK